MVVAPFDEFALTPGDIAVAYGEIGNRFASLALAYVERPRTDAVRHARRRRAGRDRGPRAAPRHRGPLRRHRRASTPTRGRPTVVAGNRVWTRPEDNATAAGTHIYTWSSGEFVFLLIGVDDAVNRAIIEQLPGEPAPTPSPRQSPTGSPSAEPSESAGG